MRTFEKAITDNMMTIVAAYRKATGKTLTQVSKEFYGRGDFFDKFSSGEQSISTRRLSEMLDKFRDEWPPETAWPLVRPVFMKPTAAN